MPFFKSMPHKDKAAWSGLVLFLVNITSGRLETKENQRKRAIYIVGHAAAFL